MSKSDLLDAARKNQLAAIIAEAFAPSEQDPTTSSGARPTSSLRVVPRPGATRLGCASKGMKGKNDSRKGSKKVVKQQQQQQQTKQATPSSSSSSKPQTATSGGTPRPGSRTPDALPEQQQDDDAQLVFDVRQTLDGIEDMDEAVVALRTLCRSRLESSEMQEDSDENNNSGSGDEDDTEDAREESNNPTGGGTSPLSEEHSEGSSKRHRDPEQGDEEDSDQPEADGMGADGKDKDGVGLEILDLTAEQCRELREEQDLIDAELEEEGEDLYLTTQGTTSPPRRHDGQEDEEEERPTCVSPTRGHVKPAVESTPLAVGTRGAEDPTFRLLPRPPKPLVEAESLPKPGVLRSHINAGASASQAGGESAASSEVTVELVPSGLPGFYQWRCQGCRSMNSVPEWVGKYVSPDSPLKGVAGKGGAGGDASRTVQLSQDEALMLKCPLCDTTPN